MRRHEQRHGRSPKVLAPPPERPPPDVTAIHLAGNDEPCPQGDPARQAELFQAAKDAAPSRPPPATNSSSHWPWPRPAISGSDPVAAQRQLSELLARPETLLPVERLLALVELKEGRPRLILQEENKRCGRTHRANRAISCRRSIAACSRIGRECPRLRKALDEAQAKLEAVTHIERSINDRGTNGSHTPCASGKK
jgi:hypothetical protein